MKKRAECTREDVLEVAHSLNFKPTEAQIQEVIEVYDEIADNDPSGYWKLWIEQALYNLEVEKTKPPKTREEKQDIVDAVIEQIKKDIADGDTTVLDELLSKLTTKVLIESLPEEEWDKYQ